MSNALDPVLRWLCGLRSLLRRWKPDFSGLPSEEIDWITDRRIGELHALIKRRLSLGFPAIRDGYREGQRAWEYDVRLALAKLPGEVARIVEYVMEIEYTGEAAPVRIPPDWDYAIRRVGKQIKRFRELACWEDTTAQKHVSAPRECPAADHGEGYQNSDVSDVGHERAIDGEASSDPVSYLWSWRDILAALGLPWDPANKDRVRKLNDLTAGPISRPKRGAQPKVVKAALLAWWNNLQHRFDEIERREADARATVAQRHPHGKGGTVIPDIAGHEKPRRSK